MIFVCFVSLLISSRLKVKAVLLLLFVVFSFILRTDVYQRILKFRGILMSLKHALFLLLLLFEKRFSLNYYLCVLFLEWNDTRRVNCEVISDCYGKCQCCEGEILLFVVRQGRLHWYRIKPVVFVHSNARGSWMEFYRAHLHLSQFVEFWVLESEICHELKSDSVKSQATVVNERLNLNFTLKVLNRNC